MKTRAAEKGACFPVGAPARKARLFVQPSRSTPPVVAEVFVSARMKPLCSVPLSRR
jgi:hypothetical protein